jgi:RimJ/RimL family protein N-acetyltransferase
VPETLSKGETVSEIACDELPDSERVRRRSLSELFWSLDWNRHFPVELTDDGITVHASSYDAAHPFISEHSRAIFREDPNSAFSTTRLDARKADYYRRAGDFFEIRKEERTVGIVVGNPVDWSTYYIRSAAVLPEFQCRQLAPGVLRLLFVHLAAVGVERVEADTSPSNLRVVQILTNLHFNVTGTVLGDRWGAQVRFTRFLDAQSEDVFLQQFCMGVPYQLRARVQREAADKGPERRPR